MSELRTNEQKTLLALEKLNGKASVEQIVESSGLAHAAVMRGVLSLKENKLIVIHEKKMTHLSLTSEGVFHAENSLPERRLLNSLIKLGGDAKVNEVISNAGLENQFVTVALGWLNRKGWAIIKNGNLKPLKKPLIGEDEKLLQLLNKKGPLVAEELNPELRKKITILKGRKLVEVEEKTGRDIELTPNGNALIKKGITFQEEVSQLTPELIRTGNWRKVKLRRFDVTAPGPVKYPGKIHPVQQVIRQVKEIFLEMGFTEIRGDMVETAFWNFDALFQPQDHPARDMVDTFYLSNPNKGKLPEKAIVDAVAKTHENGWNTGSRGWEYKWNIDEAKKLVLRTHTTATTIRYLKKHKKPPVRVFSVDRVYRNEKLDYKHLAEFHQIEAIIKDNDV
ncbi:phenylalanine--tRNA ligase subunit alpha, partial [Candidatus Bathyarchaeota archaeon]|nr:phenylalanine--tRNA ligase subunit alpha [Candidatus Bathyarchaeota archaeon]